VTARGARIGGATAATDGARRWARPVVLQMVEKGEPSAGGPTVVPFTLRARLVMVRPSGGAA